MSSNTMGPVRNQECEDEEFVETFRMSRRDSISPPTTPDIESHNIRSPASTFSCPAIIEHDRDPPRPDAWMGYSGLWPRQPDIYSSQRPTPSHSYSRHVPPSTVSAHIPPHCQPRPRSLSFRPTTTCTSTSATSPPPTYNNAPAIREESEVSISQSDSRPAERPQRRLWNGIQTMPASSSMPSSSTSTSSGLMDTRDLTRPVPMLGNTNCMPMSDKVVDYTLNMGPTGGEGMRNALKRKLSWTLNKAASTVSKSEVDSEDAQAEKRRRFTRTTEALKNLGLWEVAIRTGKMIVQNRQLQKDLDQLKQDSKQLMMSVLKNPENERLKLALATMHARIKAHKHQIFNSCNVSIKT